MLSEWRKFAGWRVLEYFLDNPRGERHIKELARLLGASPRSVQVYCDVYEKDGVFITERKANARMVRLDNELPLVQALKKAYFLARLNECGALNDIIKENPGAISMVLYGSHASGRYDETSDVDLMVVSDRKVERASFLKLEKELDREVQLTELPLVRWQSMKEKKGAFALSVLSNNVVLHGVEL
jgi:predicted nucleotidyltransferase